jgi:hypothetical protein
LIYIGGYHLLYIYHQQQLKTEMKAFLKANHGSGFGSKLVFPLSSGKIENADFSWEEENEEFRFQQELYDVVSIEKKNGTIEILCLKDNNENQLENQLNEIHKLNKTNSSKSSQNTLKFFSLFYLQKNQVSNIKFSTSQPRPHLFSSDLLVAFFDIQSPPPRC